MTTFKIAIPLKLTGDVAAVQMDELTAISHEVDNERH